MRHTYILEEGLWILEGFYFDNNKTSTKVGGSVEIIHQEENWILKAQIIDQVSGNTFINYSKEINPFKEKAVSSKWRSNIEFVGEFTGRYMIADDYLVSVFETESKNISGTEYAQKIGDNFYRDKGVVVVGKNEMISWNVDLKRN